MLLRAPLLDRCSPADARLDAMQDPVTDVMTGGNDRQEVLGHSRAPIKDPSPNIGFHLPSASWKNGTANTSQVSLGPPVTATLESNGHGQPAVASSSSRRLVSGSHLTTSVSSQASTRQPNEEEDAYHVRNTCE